MFSHFYGVIRTHFINSSLEKNRILSLFWISRNWRSQFWLLRHSKYSQRNEPRKRVQNVNCIRHCHRHGDKFAICIFETQTKQFQSEFGVFLLPFILFVYLSTKIHQKISNKFLNWCLFRSSETWKIQKRQKKLTCYCRARKLRDNTIKNCMKTNANRQIW